MNKIRRLAALMCFGLLIIGQVATAADSKDDDDRDDEDNLIRWRSDRSGQWDDARNWRPQEVPSETHEVHIDTHGEPVVVTGPAEATTVRSLTLGNLVSFRQNTLNLVPGGSITASEEFSIGFNSALGVEIAGTGEGQFPQIAAGIRASLLGATLNLSLADGYTPSLGDRFPIITAERRTGAFFRIRGIFQDDGLALAPFYDEQDQEGLTVIAALPGDADLNGVVGLGDLGALLDNLGQPGDWSQGNFNGSFLTSLGDLGILLDNLGRSAPSVAAAPALSAIPEPTTLLLMTVGLMGALRRRRSVVRCPLSVIRCPFS